MRYMALHCCTLPIRREAYTYASVCARQCAAAVTLVYHACRYVNCVEDICSSPEATVGLYMDSHFCMVPPGYESVRRAPFDAMLAGCIPVFFDHFFLKQV